MLFLSYLVPAVLSFENIQVLTETFIRVSKKYLHQLRQHKSHGKLRVSWRIIPGRV